MTTGSQKVPSASAAARIASILGQFTQGDTAMRLTDLSIGTALPKSTLHRHLTGLVDSDLLVRDKDRCYRLGPVVHRIARGLATANAAG